MASTNIALTALRPWRQRYRDAGPAQRARRYRLSVIVGALIASSFGLAALFPSQAAFASRAVPPVGQQPGMAEIVVKPDDFGTISKYLFGTNLLWADDAEGAFDPVTGNFYPGFVSLLRDLGVTAIRYPAGTTSDSFDWQHAMATGRPGSPTSLMVCKRRVFPRSVACSMAPRPRPWAPTSSANC